MTHHALGRGRRRCRCSSSPSRPRAAAARRLGRPRRLVRRGPADPEPVALAARLPALGSQLRAPRRGRDRADARRRLLQRREDRPHDRPQSTSAGTNPPQFNALSAATKVVSVQIGGNDIGFTEILQNCVTYNPFAHAVPEPLQRRRRRPDQRADRGHGAEGRGGAPGHPVARARPRACSSSTTPRSCPRPAAAAGRRCRSPTPTCRTCAPSSRSSTRCWRRRPRRTARRLRATPTRQHRPRRVQVDVDALGRAARARQRRGAVPSERAAARRGGVGAR